MREFLSVIIMPLPFWFLLLGGAILFLILKWKRTAQMLFILSCFWILFISTWYLPAFLVSNLERQYKQLQDNQIQKLPDSFNIIVLGAGHSDDMTLSPNNQLSQEVMGRLVEAVRIYKTASGIRHQASGNLLLSSDTFPRKPETGSLKPDAEYLTPNAKLIMSGYKGRSEISQAEVLFRTGLILGIDSAAMEISDKPHNTITEAEEYVKKFGTERPLVVVTSASHMKRAVEIFQNKGITIIPAPCNFNIKHGSSEPRGLWIPSGVNIRMMEMAIHEYAGMGWNNIRRAVCGMGRAGEH
jgi:uncharacterized SAM-binding protein YcdF (DUF218 family)